jgi:hypothetical protein
MTRMRGKFLRLLVLVAIGLGAPIQGVVAATAGLCAMQSHDAGHDHDADGGAGADFPIPGEGHAQHHKHCAPCVACCTAIAIVPTIRPLLESEPAPAPEILVGPTLPGIQPDALDRPPLDG